MTAQDLADGAALRRLREALGPDDSFDLGVAWRGWAVGAWHAPSQRRLVDTTGDTIAEAADACREALR